MSDSQCPVDLKERKEILAEPPGFVPEYSDLLEAVRAHMLWEIAEEKTLGSFNDRMDLCSYAEWTAKRALGLPHEPEWKGIPRIVIRFNHPKETHE